MACLGNISRCYDIPCYALLRRSLLRRVRPCVRPFVLYPAIDQHKHPFYMLLSVGPSIHSSINPPIPPSSNHPSIDISVRASIHPSNHAIIHPSSHPGNKPSIHPSTHASLHPSIAPHPRSHLFTNTLTSQSHPFPPTDSSTVAHVTVRGGVWASRSGHTLVL